MVNIVLNNQFDKNNIDITGLLSCKCQIKLI